MISALQSELEQNVSAYVRHKSDLTSVQDWLWPFMADLEESEDELLRSAAGRVGSLISEYSDGNLKEADLRKELAAAIRP